MQESDDKDSEAEEIIRKMDAKDSDFLMMEIRENVGNIESKLVAFAIHTR